MVYSYMYPRPAVTVDILLFSLTGKILLIQRKNEPFKKQWAIPGGFLDMDETAHAAAERELREETGIDAPELFPLGFYDDPNRDPRGRTISLAFWTITKTELTPKAGDDAAVAKWFSLDKLPKLSFDHPLLIQDGIETIQETIHCDPDFIPYLINTDKKEVTKFSQFLSKIKFT